MNSIEIIQTACEMSIFLMLLPLIIGHLVPTIDEKWTRFLDFIQITERIYSPVFTDSDLCNLEHLLTEFFCDYSIQSIKNSLKPKGPCFGTLSNY